MALRACNCVQLPTGVAGLFATPHPAASPLLAGTQLARDTRGQPVPLGLGRAAAVFLGRLGDKDVAVKVRFCGLGVSLHNSHVFA